EIEAVRDRERAFLVSVECDVFEARLRGPLGFARNSDLPAVFSQGVRDGSADVARAAEDEGASGYRCLDRDDRIAEVDLAVAENVGVEAAAMDERLDHARLCHRLERRAGLTELDPFAFEVPSDQIARPLRRQGLSVDRVPPRCPRLSRVLALRPVNAALADDREPAVLEDAQLAQDTVAASVPSRPAGPEPEPIALDA